MKKQVLDDDNASHSSTGEVSTSSDGSSPRRTFAQRLFIGAAPRRLGETTSNIDKDSTTSPSMLPHPPPDIPLYGKCSRLLLRSPLPSPQASPRTVLARKPQPPPPAIPQVYSPSHDSDDDASQQRQEAHVNRLVRMAKQQQSLKTAWFATASAGNVEGTVIPPRRKAPLQPAASIATATRMTSTSTGPIDLDKVEKTPSKDASKNNNDDERSQASSSNSSASSGTIRAFLNNLLSSKQSSFRTHHSMHSEVTLKKSNVTAKREPARGADLESGVHVSSSGDGVSSIGTDESSSYYDPNQPGSSSGAVAGNNAFHRRRRRYLLASAMVLILFGIVAVIVSVILAGGSDENGGGDSASSSSTSTTQSPISSSAIVPTAQPSTAAPTFPPTMTPSKLPTTSAPTIVPSVAPTAMPSVLPSLAPSPAPSTSPTAAPSTLPSFSPTVSFAPSSAPSTAPSTVFSTTILQPVIDLPGSQPAEQYGHSVDMSSDGSVIAVGARHFGNGALFRSGRVQVFVENANRVWSQRGQTLFGRDDNDQFAYAVSLSNDASILAVSEPGFDGPIGDRTGNVRIFKFEQGTNTWQPLGQEIPGVAVADLFGMSLKLSGDGRRLAIGSPYHDDTDNSLRLNGQVRVFGYSPIENKWNPVGNALNGRTSQDWFGWSVDMSNDGGLFCVGAPREILNGGYVRCFEWENASWQPLPDIVNSINPTKLDDRFGMAVSIDSTSNPYRVAVGAPWKDSESNQRNVGFVAAYEFNEDRNQWTMLGAPIFGETTNDRLGWSLAFSNFILTAGVLGRNSVQVYKYLSESNTWDTVSSELQGDFGGDEFGYSLATSSDSKTLVVAATQSTTFTGYVRVARHA